MHEKHCKAITKVPAVAQQSTLEIKLNGITGLIDQLLLAQRWAAWGVAWPKEDTANGGTN